MNLHALWVSRKRDDFFNPQKIASRSLLLQKREEKPQEVSSAIHLAAHSGRRVADGQIAGRRVQSYRDRSVNGYLLIVNR
jgi:hypothetical protein